MSDYRYRYVDRQSLYHVTLLGARQGGRLRVTIFRVHHVRIVVWRKRLTLLKPKEAGCALAR